MAAPTAPILGFQGKLYRNSGTYESPTWVLVDNVGDLELPLEAGEANISVRSGNGFELVVPGLIKYGLNFKMVYDPADANQTALRAAFFARTAIEFLALDQAVATAGSSGVRATMCVLKCSRSEALAEAMMCDVALKPTYAANGPAAYTVSA